MFKGLVLAVHIHVNCSVQLSSTHLLDRERSAGLNWLHYCWHKFTQISQRAGNVLLQKNPRNKLIVNIYFSGQLGKSYEKMFLKIFFSTEQLREVCPWQRPVRGKNTGYLFSFALYKWSKLQLIYYACLSAYFYLACCALGTFTLFCFALGTLIWFCFSG